MTNGGQRRRNKKAIIEYLERQREEQKKAKANTETSVHHSGGQRKEIIQTEQKRPIVEECIRLVERDDGPWNAKEQEKIQRFLASI